MSDVTERLDALEERLDRLYGIQRRAYELEVPKLALLRQEFGRIALVLKHLEDALKAAGEALA